MPNYRRAFIKGGTFFFTVVTYKRRPIFKEESSVNLLRVCIKEVAETNPFEETAFVLLLDHLHTIWTLPDGQSDYSTRWKLIKGAFSQRYFSPGLNALPESMTKKGEKGIWQRRFWEHAIRDQDDYNVHCDYIHYNPVKHGLVLSPSEWKHSTFLEFVRQGMYNHDWGQNVGKELTEMNCE